MKLFSKSVIIVGGLLLAGCGATDELASDDSKPATSVKEVSDETSQTKASDHKETTATQEYDATTPKTEGDNTVKNKKGITEQQVQARLEEAKNQEALHQKAVTKDDKVIKKEVKELSSFGIIENPVGEYLVSFLSEDVTTKGTFYITVGQKNYFFVQSELNPKRFIATLPNDINQKEIEQASLKKLN